jgi:hypothetical protein
MDSNAVEGNVVCVVHTERESRELNSHMSMHMNEGKEELFHVESG